MLKDVVQVRATGGHRLWLRFEDGLEGELDFGQALSFDGVFAALRDEQEFARVRVDPELGTIVWPSGADLAPEELYRRLSEARGAG